MKNEIENFIEKCDNLTDKEIVEIFRHAVQEIKDNYEELKRIASNPFGFAFQTATDLFTNKEEKEEEKKETKRFIISHADMLKALNSYFYKIKNLQEQVNSFGEVIRGLKEHDKSNVGTGRFIELVTKARAGMYNSDELNHLLNREDYLPYGNVSYIKSVIFDLNRYQREKFYFYCSLTGNLSERKSNTRGTYLGIVSEIDDFKKSKEKDFISTIAVNSPDSVIKEVDGEDLYEKFINGLKDAREKCLVGVNNGSLSVFGVESDYDRAHINMGSFESEESFIKLFVQEYIDSHKFKDISKSDLDALNKIREYANEQSAKFAFMSDEDYLEYIKGQMHLSDTEKEWYDEKVELCKEANNTYSGRRY